MYVHVIFIVSIWFISYTLIASIIPMLVIDFYHVCYANTEIVMNNECAHVMLRDTHYCNVIHMYSHVTQHLEHCLTMKLYGYDVSTAVQQCTMICNIDKRCQ